MFWGPSLDTWNDQGSGLGVAIVAPRGWLML